MTVEIWSGSLRRTDGATANVSIAIDRAEEATAPVVSDPAPVVKEPAPVVTEPVSVWTIPLSWDSVKNTTRSGPVRVASTLENKSIETHAEPAAVQMGNGSTLRNVRVGKAVREGVRIGGGKYTIEGCWLEAKGAGDDHADVIQAYAGPSGGGPLDLTIRSSLIKAYNEAATAGLFVADGIFGQVTLDNVVFWGGPFGLALYSDMRTIDLYAKNVFFVGPFGWRPFDLRDAGGKVVVKQWENVCEATIKDGKLVPGKQIARP